MNWRHIQVLKSKTNIENVSYWIQQKYRNILWGKLCFLLVWDSYEMENFHAACMPGVFRGVEGEMAWGLKLLEGLSGGKSGKFRDWGRAELWGRK